MGVFSRTAPSVRASTVILGIDASRLSGVRTGVARSIESLVESWRSRDVPFQRIVLFSPVPLPDPLRDGRFMVEVLPSSGPGIFWQTRCLRRKAREIDVLFAPYTIPLAYPGRAVVWNLGVLEGPWAVGSVRARARSWHSAYSARHADAIIVNSAATAEDLVYFYGIARERITVIWPGVEKRFRPAFEGEQAEIGRAVERLLGKRVPYFLFVGKMSLRRHVPELVEAFAMVLAKRPGIRLLLVSPNDPAPIEQISARLGITNFVRHVPYVDDDTLAILYRGACAFVLPTSQEGFSATILEAAASGCPVVTTNHRALEEAELADVVLCVSEPTARHLHEALIRVVDDEALRRELGTRGRRRARSFSWNLSGQKTMELLARVAAASP